MAIEQHIIAPYIEPQETVNWLQWRGYRAIACGLIGTPGGVVFSRKNGPVTVAVVGDTLQWDGDEVTVQ